MSDQLTDLQTRLAFQEESIEELNRTVVRQAREMDELRHELKELRRQLRALTPSNIASEAEETPPPHY